MKLTTLIIALFLVTTIWTGKVSAQDEDEIDYTFGEVTKVMENKITLNEYDFDSDDFQDFDYEVNAETEFENLNGLAEIKVGDTLELDYVMQNDKRVAVYVSSAEIVEDEELELNEDEGEDQGEGEELQIVS